MMFRLSSPPRLVVAALYLLGRAVWTAGAKKGPRRSGGGFRSLSDEQMLVSETFTNFIPYGLNHPLERARRRHSRNLQFQESVDEYRNIRITFIDALDSAVRQNKTTVQAAETFRTRIMQPAAHFWEQALLVYPVPDDVSVPSMYRCIGPPAPQEPIVGTDLVVSVRLTNSITCRDGVSAFATSPCERDQYGRPLNALVGICPSLLNVRSESDIEVYTRIIIHELGHALGVAFPNLALFHDFETGLPRTPSPEFLEVPCLSANRSDYATIPGNTTVRRFPGYAGCVASRRDEVITPTVRAVTRNQFNCSTLQGARWENQAYGCFGQHWDNRVFHTELMAAASNVLLRHISPLTLALLEDSGWYLANYSMSTISTFGHAAGCDFVDKPCLVDGGVVAEYADGFFCEKSSFAGCISSHTEWKFCDLLHHDAIPDQFQYFEENATLGGLFDVLDYCPSYTRSRIKVKNWPSSASRAEGADPFSVLRATSCLDTSNSDQLVSAYEVYGPDSRCFNSNVEVSNLEVEVCDWFGDNCQLLSNVEFQLPLCLRSRCSEEKHAVEIHFDEAVHTCASDGELVELPDVPGSFIECPKLAQICPNLICPYNCAGRGFCDYSLSNPKCTCNDPDDPSPGCFHSPRFSFYEETPWGEQNEDPTPLAVDPDASPANSGSISMTSPALAMLHVPLILVCLSYLP